MRLLVPLLAVLAACATTVRDWPVDAEGPGEGEALLAGRLAFAGTGIRNRLRLQSAQGRELILRPEHAAFLVAVPAGTYRITRFGDTLAPAAGRLTLEAVAGRATYVGDFEAARDREGELRVVVRDRFDKLRAEFVARYESAAPPLVRGLVASSLAPLDAGQAELVVAVRPVPVYSGYSYFHVGYGYWYGYPYYYGYYPRYRIGHRHSHRGHVRRATRRR